MLWEHQSKCTWIGTKFSKSANLRALAPLLCTCPLLVTFGGQNSRLVQTCSLEDPHWCWQLVAIKCSMYGGQVGVMHSTGMLPCFILCLNYSCCKWYFEFTKYKVFDSWKLRDKNPLAHLGHWVTTASNGALFTYRLRSRLVPRVNSMATSDGVHA